MGQKGCRFSLFFFSPVQANLALSPSTLLPSPKGGESERRADSPPPAVVTTPPGHVPGPSVREEEEREDPVGFDGAPEGAPLPSFHKTRVRLSFKRRPPTRRHRRSAGDSPLASLDGHAASWPQADGDAVSKLDVGEDEVNEEGEEDCEQARSETTATSPGEVKDDETRQTDGREADAPC
ncbi:capZ-interacting protein isoform X2 [Stigmatopora argus]